MAQNSSRFYRLQLEQQVEHFRYKRWQDKRLIENMQASQLSLEKRSSAIKTVLRRSLEEQRRLQQQVQVMKSHLGQHQAHHHRTSGNVWTCHPREGLKVQSLRCTKWQET